MRSPTRRAGAAALVALCTGVLFAACSSGSGSGSRSTTTSTTKAKVITTTSAATTSPTAPVTTTTAVAQASTCQPRQLTMTPGQSNGAAGTIGLEITMVNTGSTCTMQGYPGMLLLSSSGTALPTNVIRGGSFDSASANAPAVLVTLHTGQNASFSLTYEDVPVGNETTCPTSTSAEITPPNAVPHNVIALAIAPCGGGTIHVSPVYAGA